MKTKEEYDQHIETSEDENLDIELETEKIQTIKTPELFTISKIKVLTDKEQKFIKQIRFTIGDNKFLTFKPKERIQKNDKFRGIEIESSSNEWLPLDKCPEKIFKLNSLLNNDGEVRVMTTYKIFNARDNEGNKQSYFFIQDKDFKTLYPVDQNNKEIKI